MLLIFFCCFLTLSAYKQQTRENEISDSCGQTYTYIKYRQKVNGYDVSVKFLKDFEEYLNRMYRKSSTLNTIILHRTPTPIEKLYVPLTLSKRIWLC